MELFNSTGFEIQDKVFIVLSDVKYFGIVVDIDDKFDRIKVDFTAKSSKPVVGWFHKSFWKKE